MQEVVAQLFQSNSYAAVTDYNSIAAGSEKPVFWLSNDSSTKELLVTSCRFGVDSDTVFSTFKVYCNPTVTANGTSIGIMNMRVGASETSEAAAYKAPTVSANGGLLYINRMSSDGRSKGIEKIIALKPGNSMLVTVDMTGAGNYNVHSSIYWLEVEP